MMIETIRRVTAGAGGEALLVLGSQKTALIDTGMAFCGPQMADRAEAELKERPLDYVLLTHSHYDHIGGLPYVRRKWPELTACAAAHAAAVLKRPGALQMIRRLSGQAALEYAKEPVQTFTDQEMQIDLALKEGDTIPLGDRTVLVLETPGHTNDSLSFFIPEDSMIFPCETIGCYLGNGKMDSPVLTSFEDTLRSIEKCRRQQAKHIISPHYGLMKGDAAQHYWDIAERSVREVRQLILELHEEGKSPEEIYELCEKRFWRSSEIHKREQPLMAFTINMRQTIKIALKNLE